MKTEVENGNANASHYGLLTDRIRINTGRKQVYGTQVAYHSKTGQAYPKPLVDSLMVNERRKAIGLEPLELYLNRMTEMHFEMNKSNFVKKGMNAPVFYDLNK
jgi:hypothetical protein